MTAAAAAIATPPCPEWCTLPAGHAYDDSDRDGEHRGHQGKVGEVRHGDEVAVAVTLEALETVSLSDSEVHITVDGPEIFVDVFPGAGESLTGDEARRVAVLLTAAADAHDQAVRS